MKRLATMMTAVGLAFGLAACSQKQATAETTVAAEAAPPAAAPSSDMANMKMATPAKTAKGTGTVTAVSGDSITIDHAPIPEANWPAMTMAFKASPAMTKQMKVGDKVAFDLKLEGGGEITATRKQ